MIEENILEWKLFVDMHDNYIKHWEKSIKQLNDEIKMLEGMGIKDIFMLYRYWRDRQNFEELIKLYQRDLKIKLESDPQFEAWYIMNKITEE